MMNLHEPAAKGSLPRHRRLTADVAGTLRRRHSLKEGSDQEDGRLKSPVAAERGKMKRNRKASTPDIQKERSTVVSVEEPSSPRSEITTSVAVSIANDESRRITPRGRIPMHAVEDGTRSLSGEEGTLSVSDSRDAISSTPLSRLDEITEASNSKARGGSEDQEEEKGNDPVYEGEEERLFQKSPDGMDGEAFDYQCRFEEHTHELHCVACKEKDDEVWIKKHSFLHKGRGALIRYGSNAEFVDSALNSGISPHHADFEGDSLREPLRVLVPHEEGSSEEDAHPADLGTKYLSKGGRRLSEGFEELMTGPDHTNEVDRSCSGASSDSEDSQYSHSEDEYSSEVELELVSSARVEFVEGMSTTGPAGAKKRLEQVVEKPAPDEFVEGVSTTAPAGAINSLQEVINKEENFSANSSIWGSPHENAPASFLPDHLDWQTSTDKHRHPSRSKKKSKEVAYGSLEGNSDGDHKLKVSDAENASLGSSSADSKSLGRMRTRMSHPYAYSTPPAGTRNFVGVFLGGPSGSSHLQTSISSIARAWSHEALNGLRPYRRSPMTVLPTICSICASCERVDNLASPHPYGDTLPRREEELQSVKQQLEHQEAGLIQSIESLRRCIADAERNAALATDAMLEEHTKVLEVASELRTDLTSQMLASRGGILPDEGLKRQAQMQAAVVGKKRESEASESELRRELKYTREKLRVAQVENTPLKEKGGLSQAGKGMVSEYYEPSSEFARSQEQRWMGHQEGSFVCEQGQPAQIVQVSFGDKSESESESLRRDLLHTQQHLHLIHHQLELLKGYSEMKSKSHKSSPTVSDFKSTLEETQEQLQLLEESHSRREIELQNMLENMQGRESDLRMQMKRIQEEHQTEIACSQENVQKVEEHCILLEEQNELLRVEAVHSESEVYRDLGSVQLELYEGHAQFTRLKEEMESNAKNEKVHLKELESQLSKSKEEFSHFRKKSLSDLQLTKGQLQLSQQQTEELSYLRKQSLQELDDTQENLRKVRLKAEELSVLDRQHRASITFKEQSEAELKDHLGQTLARLEEVEERLVGLEEQCSLLEEQNNLLRLEGVHSEFEVQVDLGLTQVQLHDAQKQYEHLKEEMQVNAERERKCLRDLEDELTHTIRKKDEELMHIDRHLRRSLSYKEQSEAELRKELSDIQAHLEEVQEMLRETKRQSADKEDIIRKTAAQREAAVCEELKVVQAHLHESQEQAAQLKAALDSNSENEKLVIEELQNQLLDSQKQTEEFSWLRRASQQDLKNAQGQLLLVQQEHILLKHLKEEMEENAESEKQYLKELEMKLSDSEEEFLNFRKKSMQDLQDMQAQLRAAQQEAQEFSLMRKTYLQDLQEIKEQLRTAREDHMEKERDAYKSGKESLIVQLEQLQMEKIQLQSQIQQVLQELSDVKEASAAVLDISVAKSDQQLVLYNSSGVKDIALSMLEFVEDVSHMLGQMHKIFEEHQDQQQKMTEEITSYTIGMVAEKDTKDAACETVRIKNGESGDPAKCEKCAKFNPEEVLTYALRTYGVDPDKGGIPDDQYTKLKRERIQRREYLSSTGDPYRKLLHSSHEGDGGSNVGRSLDAIAGLVAVKGKSVDTGGPGTSTADSIVGASSTAAKSSKRRIQADRDIHRL